MFHWWSIHGGYVQVHVENDEERRKSFQAVLHNWTPHIHLTATMPNVLAYRFSMIRMNICFSFFLFCRMYSHTGFLWLGWGSVHSAHPTLFFKGGQSEQLHIARNTQFVQAVAYLLLALMFLERTQFWFQTPFPKILVIYYRECLAPVLRQGAAFESLTYRGHHRVETLQDLAAKLCTRFIPKLKVHKILHNNEPFPRPPHWNGSNKRQAGVTARPNFSLQQLLVCPRLVVTI